MNKKFLKKMVNLKNFGATKNLWTNSKTMMKWILLKVWSNYNVSCFINFCELFFEVTKTYQVSISFSLKSDLFYKFS